MCEDGACFVTQAMADQLGAMSGDVLNIVAIFTSILCASNRKVLNELWRPTAFPCKFQASVHYKKGRTFDLIRMI
jgi:hypothetical protein